jgi:oligoribonuclease
MAKANLLWVDLEMTGLDPIEDRILEIAAIGTDWKLNEVFRYQAAVKVDPEIIKRRMVGDFWRKNRKVRKALSENSANGAEITAVEDDLLNILSKKFGKTIYLAGNSIHQDRKFMEHEMPRLNAKLHYRMLDISAWKIVFVEKFSVKFQKPEAHRALDDIEGSIEEFKFYLEKVSGENS